jgi:hypothetical protein
MDAITQADVVAILDYSTKALLALLFCLGWVAGSPR